MLREMKKINKDEAMRRFSIEFTTTHDWKVKFPSASFFEDAPDLFQDLDSYANQRQKEAAVSMSIVFKDFPAQPPFVQVLEPRFMQHTGHITIGGSICAEILTTSGSSKGWNPTIDCCQLVLLLHNLLIDGKGRIDLSSPFVHIPYTEEEAKHSHYRVARDHGWDQSMSGKKRERDGNS